MSTYDQSKEGEQNEQKYALIVYGLMWILSAGFIGLYVGMQIFHSATMAYVIAFSGVMLLGGVIGWFTVVIQKAVKEVQIKLVQVSEK